MQERCAKSMFARPKKKSDQDPEQAQDFKIKAIMAEGNLRRKQELDLKKREEMIEKIKIKDERTQEYLAKLAKKDPREIYRDSHESRMIEARLYGEKYYYIPEQYREALIKEFHKTYEKEAN